MKTVILAGGRGTRLGSLTDLIPKPMVMIGDRPILWHIMNIYASYHFTDFIIAGGYKQEIIRDWVNGFETKWSIEVVDTGEDTDTGGRIKRLAHKLTDPFFLTYGDGVGDIDLSKLLVSYTGSTYDYPATLCTVTAVHPPARFGHLSIERNRVTEFSEKPMAHEWINGGFFVCKPDLIEEISGDTTSLERTVLPRLAIQNRVGVYLHHNFWQCCDVPRDLELLNRLYANNCPWKINTGI